MNATYLRRDDAARHLGIPVHALDTMRTMGVGPRHLFFSRLGRVYRQVDLAAWIGKERG
jgi:hypothetical protein